MYYYNNIIKVYILGVVAQWTRARGYELRCQGFESLLPQYFKLTFKFMKIILWGVAKW